MINPYALLHILWSKAVGTPDYVKKEWTKLAQILLLKEERQAIVTALASVDRNQDLRAILIERAHMEPRSATTLVEKLTLDIPEDW